MKEFGVTIQNAAQARKKTSDFLGSLSKEKANELLFHVDNSRQEWERDIYIESDLIT